MDHVAMVVLAIVVVCMFEHAVGHGPTVSIAVADRCPSAGFLTFPPGFETTSRFGSRTDLVLNTNSPTMTNAMNTMNATTTADCSIQASLDILGDRWTILILRDAFRGVRKFDDFRKDLRIARPVLTDRLKRLVERGVLARHLYCERPPRYEYRLTEMGMALSPALVALMRWGDDWLSDGGAPTVLVHDTCGNPLDQQFVCWECDETFTQYDIASRPGPGAPTTD
jgi:DNA-binding HxlR family transcriptional regulator